MKKLLLFLAGVATGVAGLTLYQLIALPALPDDEWDEDDYREWAKTGIMGLDKLFTSDELNILVSLDDTQPTYLGTPGDEVGVHELDSWARESE